MSIASSSSLSAPSQWSASRSQTQRRPLWGLLLRAMSLAIVASFVTKLLIAEHYAAIGARDGDYATRLIEQQYAANLYPYEHRFRTAFLSDFFILAKAAPAMREPAIIAIKEGLRLDPYSPQMLMGLLELQRLEGDVKGMERTRARLARFAGMSAKVREALNAGR